MNIHEQLRCIKYINKKAHCVVWQDDHSDGKTQYVKYDKAHKGKKPTLKECEDVLPIIQSEIDTEEKARSQRELIGKEEKEILEDQAIQQLKDRGELPQDYEK